MGKIDLIPVKENELDKEWILETILQGRETATYTKNADS